MRRDLTSVCLRKHSAKFTSHVSRPITALSPAKSPDLIPIEIEIPLIARPSDLLRIRFRKEPRTRPRNHNSPILGILLIRAIGVCGLIEQQIIAIPNKPNRHNGERKADRDQNQNHFPPGRHLFGRASAIHSLLGSPYSNSRVTRHWMKRLVVLLESVTLACGKHSWWHWENHPTS